MPLVSHVIFYHRPLIPFIQYPLAWCMTVDIDTHTTFLSLWPLTLSIVGYNVVWSTPITKHPVIKWPVVISISLLDHTLSNDDRYRTIDLWYIPHKVKIYYFAMDFSFAEYIMWYFSVFMGQFMGIYSVVLDLIFNAIFCRIFNNFDTRWFQ